MPLVSEDHHSTVLEAFEDLGRFNLLQPNQAMTGGKGVQARRRQWNRMAGGREGRPNPVWIGAGLAFGAVGGLIASLQVPAFSEYVPMPLLLAAVLAPVGGYVGHIFSSSGAYHQGMMLVVANERRSLIRPEMVTGQVEAWIPKALLSWRSHEWRYRDGRPYLWLQLPGGQRIEEELRGTLDYLRLPNDLHRAKDAAVYAQRSWNRMISDTALDFADVDEGDDGSDSWWKDFVPFMIAGGIAAGGLLLAMMTYD